MTKNRSGHINSVGWLQYFFENHLPESPCPPGCRHRHSSFKRHRKNQGSVCSGSPQSSDVGDEILSTTDYSSYSTEDSSYKNNFSPIPLILDPPHRKISNPYSDCGSSGGPDYKDYCHLHENDLKELDDLISIYSEKLSETESDMKSGSSSQQKILKESPLLMMRKKQNTHTQFSFSDTEIEHYHRPLTSSGCGVSNCHCTNKLRKVSTERYIRIVSHKSYCDVGTQCMNTDIVRVLGCDNDDDNTLTKTRDLRKLRSYTTKGSSSSDESGEEKEAGDDDIFTHPPLISHTDPHLDLTQTSSGNTASSCITTSSNITELTISTFNSHDNPLREKSSNELTKISSLESDKMFSVSPDKENLPLIDAMTSVSNFTPFMIDFFEFATRPEDFLTDEQLSWYYEGEAKLMKRREERKRARNALIEETARLEQTSGVDSGSDKRSISVSSREKQRTNYSSNDVRSALPEVEDVDIPQDLLDNPTVIRLAQQLNNSQNLHKDEMVKCAKLDNERSTLLYSVEDLKDQLEDQTELAAELKITLKAKCRDIEKLKMQLAQKSKDVEMLTQQVHQREELLQEKAGIVITQLGDIMEVPLDDEGELQNGVLEKYSIKKVEEIEKENNSLKEEIEALRLELQQRPRTQLNNHVDNAADTDLLNIKRELEKAVETYKAKLTVEERDKIKLLGQISVLESQVNRYRAQAKSASEAEDEALKEKRKILKELRTVKEDLQNTRDENAILQRRVQRPTINR